MKDRKATVVVVLTRDEKDIFNGLHKDARWGVRKALSENLVVEESDDWTTFYNIYKIVMIEGNSNFRSLDYLKANGDVLFLCKKDDSVLGGAVIQLEGEAGYPRLRFNASFRSGLKFQPNNLLYWNCILRCKSEGYDTFDFGGWQIKARGHSKGINKFKEKWGNIIYFEKDYPPFRAIGRKLIRKYDLFWWLNNKIKRFKMKIAERTDSIEEGRG